MKIADIPRELDVTLCMIASPPDADVCGTTPSSTWLAHCENQCATTEYGCCSSHERLLERPGWRCTHCHGQSVALRVI